VLVPPFAIATADAYRWLADGRGSYVPRAAVLHPALLASWDVLSTGAVNDFEGVVASRHPEIARTVVRLRDAGARLAMMSGSGSTVFGVFDDVDAADAADRLRDLPGGATIAWTRSADRVVPVALDG